MVAFSAAAQSSSQPNWRAQPTSGTVSLSNGFLPDPYTRSVQAGGSSSNPISGSGCAGYIDMSAPNLDLNYESGSLPLTIDAESNIDVTLLVYTPDGTWICNDDGGDGTNARVRFDNPMSGNYNIWVGTYNSSVSNSSSTVSFSERTSSGSSHALNWQAQPTSGTVSLSAGFLPDPHVTTIAAGGAHRNPLEGSGCVGMLNASAPDLDLNYSAGSSSLYIYTRSNADVTLVVYTPAGEWICNDDGGDGRNAMIRFSNPQSGNYNIWVGAYNESNNYAKSELRISEIEP